MLIRPAGTALLLVRNFYSALLLGVAAPFSGLYLSFYFDLPSGLVMALLTTVFFILALTWKQLVARVTGPGRPNPAGSRLHVLAVGRAAPGNWVRSDSGAAALGACFSGWLPGTISWRRRTR